MENEQVKNEYIEKLEDSLQSTPSETRDFLWSSTYKNLLEAVSKQFNLSIDQKTKLDLFIFETIIGVIQPEDVPERVNELGISEEVQDSLFAYIYDYFIDIAAQEPQNVAGLNKKEISPLEPGAITPTDILTRLNQTFTTPATLTPTKRDLSGTSTTPMPDTAPVVTPSSEKHIDPYREIPEK